MTGRSIALVAAFTITRLAGAWLADHPEAYGGGVSPVGDPTLYRFWATQVLDHGAVPYTDVRIEYPPGSLPVILAPALVPVVPYRTGLITLLVAVDVLGMVGLLRIARRRGSMLGPWLWTVLIPLVGPIAYLRLDLVPAAATIWAMERASVQGWFGAGGWLGFGAAAKLYPFLLLPAGYLAARRRGLLVAGAAVVLAIALIPFVAAPRGLLHSLGYHLGRGIEIESLWGAILLVVSRFGYPIGFRFDFESLNVLASAATALRVAAGLLAVSAVAAGIWLAARMSFEQRRRHLSAVMFGTLATVVAVSTVLSPQYVLWIVALGAAAACWASSPIRRLSLLLVPISACTQAIYPFLFEGLAAREPLPIVVLAARDLLLLVVGVGSFILLRRTVAERRDHPSADVSR